MKCITCIFPTLENPGWKQRVKSISDLRQKSIRRSRIGREAPERPKSFHGQCKTPVLPPFSMTAALAHWPHAMECRCWVHCESSFSRKNAASFLTQNLHWKNCAEQADA